MYFIQFLCLQNLSTPSETEDSVAAFVKPERFSPCLGHGMCKLQKNIEKKTFFLLKTYQTLLVASLRPLAITQVTIGPKIT